MERKQERELQNKRDSFKRIRKSLKSNCYEIQDKHRDFEKGTEESEKNVRPLVGPLVKRILFLIRPFGKHLIFQTISVC
jgi:hypothetical protein